MLERAPVDIEARIVGELDQSPLTTSILASHLKEEPSEVKRHCLHLERAHQVVHFSRDDILLLSSLRSHGPQSTRELADATGLDTKHVYQRCRHFMKKTESDPWLSTSKRRSSRKLFFFPATRSVMSAENFQEVNEITGHLRKIVRQHRYGSKEELPKKVKREIRRESCSYLHQLEAAATDQKRRYLKAFENDFMLALNSTTPAELVSTFSPRPFHPQEVVWHPHLPLWVDRLLDGLAQAAIDSASPGSEMQGNPFWNGDPIWVVKPSDGDDHDLVN